MCKMAVAVGKKRGEILLQETPGLRCIARLNDDLSGDIVIQGIDNLGNWYDKIVESKTVEEIKSKTIEESIKFREQANE